MRKQSGFTLIELMVALVIVAALSSGIYKVLIQDVERQKAAIAAENMKIIGQAAKRYIQDNYSGILAVATATQPALITTGMLSSAGYLAGGFSATNAYGHNMCVLVSELAPGELQALVVAEGGDAINDMDLGAMVGQLGGAGGAVYSDSPTVINGARGGWSTPVSTFDNRVNDLNRNCAGAAGRVRVQAGRPVMALWFAEGDVNTGVIHRDAIPGRPELNRMNTDLDMGSNSVTGLRVVSEGSSCSGVASGTLASDSTGRVMTCQGGSWQMQGSRYWRDPVASYANLGACSANELGMTRIARNANDGASRPRAYTCNGSSWRPLGLDQNGDLRVERNLYVVGSSNVGSQTVRGNQTVQGRATINELAGNLTVQSVATAGTACSPNGRIARDSNGLLLSCQSGSWEKAQGGGGDGITGFLSPFKGMNRSCTLMPGASNEMVFYLRWAGDTPQVRVKSRSCDTGYVNGTSVSCNNLRDNISATIDFTTFTLRGTYTSYDVRSSESITRYCHSERFDW